MTDGLILKPRPWRWFVCNWTIYTIGAIIGTGIYRLFRPGPLFSGFLEVYIICLTVGLILYSRRSEKWQIVVSARAVEGPAMSILDERTQIEIEQIDRFRKSPVGALGKDYICSKTGEKIFVDSLALGKEQVLLLRSRLKI